MLDKLLLTLKRNFAHVGRPGVRGGAVGKGNLFSNGELSFTKNGYNKTSSKTFLKSKKGKTSLVEENNGRWKLTKIKTGEKDIIQDGLNYKDVMRLSEQWLNTN